MAGCTMPIYIQYVALMKHPYIPERLNLAIMKLVKIDYHNGVLPETKRDTSTAFNTSFHTASEAPFDPNHRPSERPYSFQRWLPLILRTRGLAPSAAQTIPLSRPQAQLLLEAAEASIPKGDGTLNRLYVEDVASCIVEPVLSELQFPPEGLFVRLAACSPKDGMKKDALHSPDDVVLKIVTSIRARNAIRQALDEGEEKEADRSFELPLSFLPFDGRMGSVNEYRVFCPPGGKKISGISQYQWHKPWKFASLPKHPFYPKGADNMTAKISERAEDIRKLVMEELHERGEGDNDDDVLFLKQGFTFDILYEDLQNTCELVELNVFGARSPCGSCLFHWVKDREVLWGVEGVEPEFRIAI